MRESCSFKLIPSALSSFVSFSAVNPSCHHLHVLLFTLSVAECRMHVPKMLQIVMMASPS